MEEFNKMKSIKNLSIISLIVMCFLLLSGHKSYASEVSVTTWAEFKNAYEDSTVSKIKLTEDIIQPASSNGSISGNNSLTASKRRTTSLEIDGSKPNPSDKYDHYKLSLGRDYMGVLNPTEKDYENNIVFQTLHVHDVILSNVTAGTTSSSGSIFGLPDYTPTDSNTYTKNWILKLGNIVVPEGNTERIARWTRGQIYIYGDNNVNTLGENFYLGGVEFAKDSKWFGNITQKNYSIFWWRHNTKSTDSGSGKFIIGDNSVVKLRNTNVNSTGYPALYAFFTDIEIGENAQFTATVPGSALQFHGNGQSVTAKKNSIVTLTSLSNNTVISDTSVMGGVSTTVGYDEGRIPFNNGYATNLNLNFEPTSSLYVIGKTNGTGTPLIELGGNSNSYNNSITLDTPNQFDIRNNGNGRSNIYDAVQVQNSKGNSFNVLNSNLAMWKINSNYTNTADYQGTDVASFSISDANKVTSSDKNLETELNNIVTSRRSNLARINGLNSKPSVEWEYTITNADKNLNNMARVILGEVPDDNGLDENGDLHFTKQYANRGLTVKIINNQDSKEFDLETNDDGYISMVTEDYFVQNTIFSAVATRGRLESDKSNSDKVFNITPPLPATTNSGKIYNTDTEIKGNNAEPGSKLSVKVNGVMLSKTVTVENDGTYTFPLDNKLIAGDKVTIYLQDSAGKAPDKLQHLPAPITNSDVGNINPDKTLSYSDATFPEATTYIVEQGLSKLTIKFENEDGQVMDGYTLTVGHEVGNSIETPLYIGDNIDLTSPTFNKLQNQLVDLENAGYEITSRPDNETSFPITDVEQTIVYKVKGLLFLESAPDVIDFGSVKFTGKTQNLSKPVTDKDLIVKDTRSTKDQGWTLYAKLSSEMTNTSTGSIMKDALRYVTIVNDTKKEITLNNQDHAVVKSSIGGTSNITDSWKEGTNEPGLKLVADPNKTTVSSIGSYSGVITWTIMAGEPM